MAWPLFVSLFSIPHDYSTSSISNEHNRKKPKVLLLSFFTIYGSKKRPLSLVLSLCLALPSKLHTKPKKRAKFSRVEINGSICTMMRETKTTHSKHFTLSFFSLFSRLFCSVLVESESDVICWSISSVGSSSLVIGSCYVFVSSSSSLWFQSVVTLFR